MNHKAFLWFALFYGELITLVSSLVAVQLIISSEYGQNICLTVFSSIIGCRITVSLALLASIGGVCVVTFKRYLLVKKTYD